MIGFVSGRLTVLERAGSHPTSGNIMVRAACACGAEVVVAWSQVKRGKTRSCGCLQVEAATRSALALRTHCMHGTPEYQAWRAMLSRCQNKNVPNHPGYGGRGIRVCERWQVFENFISDMGRRPSPAHSLDRIDNDGNYEPENCRWATNTVQQRNKRNAVLVTWAGETLPVREWEDRLGFRKELLYGRLKKGWSVERAMTEPVHTEKSHPSRAVA